MSVATKDPKISYLDVADLKLDPENPRLPEGLRRTPSAMLRYLYENGALDELAQSYLDNGFFEHEPIIVLKEGKNYLVVEGNRRLASLMVLHGVPEAEGLTFAGIEASKEDLKNLNEIPAFQIADRDEAHSFLGFRHIGGIKTWDADAKARYLQLEVERAAKGRSIDPFKDVGRRVGSNAQGVRNSFIAIKGLQIAREEYGVDISYVMQRRFGVWLRCMNSGAIREYIGLDSPKTYAEVIQQLKELKGPRIKEVVGDLTPPESKTKAVIADSRQVTAYGRVLSDKDARAALRKYGDLNVAIQLVNYSELGVRLSQIVDSCKIVYEQLPYVPRKEDLQEPAEQLVAVSGSIRDVVFSKVRAK
jgi:hypothetical protein